MFVCLCRKQSPQSWLLPIPVFSATGKRKLAMTHSFYQISRMNYKLFRSNFEKFYKKQTIAIRLLSPGQSLSIDDFHTVNVDISAYALKHFNHRQILRWINVADVTILASNYGYTLLGLMHSSPEPSSVILMVIALLGSFKWFRHSHQSRA